MSVIRGAVRHILISSAVIGTNSYGDAEFHDLVSEIDRLFAVATSTVSSSGEGHFGSSADIRRIQYFLLYVKWQSRAVL